MFVSRDSGREDDGPPHESAEEQELRDLMVRERGGAVKQEKKVIDKTDEGKAQPQAQPAEPCCGRCGRPKSQVKLWIKKRQKCQNCLSAEIKERKKAYLAECNAKVAPPQAEPNAPVKTKAPRLKAEPDPLTGRPSIEADGPLDELTHPTETHVDRAPVSEAAGAQFIGFNPEYAKLVKVFEAAYEQTAEGKGKERHAVEDQPFEMQTMCEITRRVQGSPVSPMLYQAVKKCYESPRLSLSRARTELLGAIDYLAAGVILLDEQIAAEPKKETLNIRIRTLDLTPSGIEEIIEKINKASKYTGIPSPEEPTL